MLLCENVIRYLLLAILPVLIAACLGYQPPSGRGYDYDRGQAVARGDIREDHFIYYVSGYEADSLASMSTHVEANCGFRLKPAYSGASPDIRDVEFAEGYNSVSVPVIETRLGSRIKELMKRCTINGISD